jgi:hypothetical protein
MYINHCIVSPAYGGFDVVLRGQFPSVDVAGAPQNGHRDPRPPKLPPPPSRPMVARKNPSNLGGGGFLMLRIGPFDHESVAQKIRDILLIKFARDNSPEVNLREALEGNPLLQDLSRPSLVSNPSLPLPSSTAIGSLH